MVHGVLRATRPGGRYREGNRERTLGSACIRVQGWVSRVFVGSFLSDCWWDSGGRVTQALSYLGGQGFLKGELHPVDGLVHLVVLLIAMSSRW